MKTITALVTFVTALALGGIGQASIIGWGIADDGDGAIVCNGSWDAGTSTMGIVGNQYWGPGHMGTLPLSATAYFQTDTELDPTVTMRNTIDNDTGSSWSGYHINVYMNKAFSVSVATIYTPDTSEPGWSGSITVSPAVWNGSEYQAQVDYTGGTAIPDGGTIDFSYKMIFTGSVQYCQEMIPTLVPEPGTFVLALGGLLGLVALRRRTA